ncbi:S8 family serine peptidase [Parvicella tangerina]|uniref:PKD domain-containing protein n=1 Tax=Parvicella tangerina TaxID=2829795 RepID=A0A916JN61_9FLAO|nr:S8 family serine peptidase [Parvicella tangerina]CAG5083216.1 hypothetical protein CRYO30217_02125 [Parvicella tangerina]
MKPAFLFAVLFAMVANIQAQTVYSDYQDGLIIFQLKTDKQVPIIPSNKGIVSFETDPILKRMDAKYTIVSVKQLYPDHDYEVLERTYQIEFANPSQIDAFIEDLSRFNAIEYAEKKELHHTCLTPNDTYFSNSFSNGQWALFQINAQQAWDISTGDANTVVAVTDNAINTNHPDLTNKMLQGWDAVDSDTDPSPCGSNDGFHGSHVSGIVGAETNNNLGVASIGYDVSILPVKIGNCSGSLTAGYEGIVWAADNGADVINMSWGGGGSSTYGQNVCDYAWNQGAILVAAAGNDGVNSVFYPAGYNNVVSVASTTSGDSKSSFSNYGSWIDISAPGSSILSCNDGNGYQVTQGTSMASPMVAGLVGLMKSHAVGASNADIINCLYSSADNIDAANSSYVGQLGAGRINAHQAMVCANSYAFQLDAGVSSIGSPEGNLCYDTYSPEVILRNYGSNTLTSATITYQVSGSGSQTYNWSGSLTTGQTATITLPVITSTSGSYTFSASTSSPNGSTDQNPSNDGSINNFSVIPNGDQVTLEILTDCYGSEITWEIVDDQSNIVANGGPYADVTGGQLETASICLAPGCYTFNINDSYGDGMYGSQWSCTVDGDYSMQDGSGNTLFTMTAANGDFGNGTSHTFCVSSPIPDDAGIVNVSSPDGSYCNGSIIPEVDLQNLGNQTLSNCVINYQLAGGAVQTYNWSGSLTPNQSETVTLPVINATAGNQTFIAYTTFPNGNTDGNNLNDTTTIDFTVFTNGLNLPFTEDFENGFTNQNWSIENADGGITWQLAAIAGTTPGSQAAKMDFFNYGQQGERDELITPLLDFSGQSTVDLYFEYAYRRYDQNSTDSLIVSISTDCGQSFTRLIELGEDGTGSFATAYTNTAAFTPAAGDWCMGTVGADCRTISLDAYAGQSNVFIKFEGYNAGTNGNNLFIDNINISGDVVANCPEISVSPTDVSCNSGTDGTVTISAVNGVAPLTYSIDNINYGSNNLFSGLSEGSYMGYVKGSDGCIDSLSFSISEPTPISLTTTTQDENCGQVDGELNIVASGGTAPYEYSVDGGTNYSISSAFTGLSSSTYSVMVRDDNGCTQSSSVVVSSSGGNFSMSTSGDQTICEGSSVTIFASGVPSGGSYSWDQNLGNGANQTVSPTATTVYTVTGTDGNGCSQSTSLTVTVNAIPVVNVTTTNTTICEGETTTLLASGAQTYTWNTGATGATLTVSPSSSMTYTVVGQNGTCSSSSVSESITVNPSPNVTAGASVSNALVGEVINFSSTGSNATSYNWNFGDGGTSTSANDSYSYSAQGTYTVELTGELNGCTATDQVTVVIEDVSGIDENIFGLSVYPNPSNGVVSIQVNQDVRDLMLTVYDLSGKVVVAPITMNSLHQYQLDLGSVSEGVYLLRLQDGKDQVTKRITILR